MAKYTHVTIIYNPNSTGGSKKRAEYAYAKLQKHAPKLTVTLMPTEYAGHAEELAYEAAQQSRHPVVVSVSGDGGYHEVVNGAMQANANGAKAVTGLIPAGNANDHYHSVHAGDLVAAILKGKSQSLDVLTLKTTVAGKPIERYAHSYIGFGMTPRVGRELTKEKLNRAKEVWITARTLLTYRSSTLVVDGTAQEFQSIIFSNIDRMAKILTLSTKSKPDDGKFEVNILRRQHKIGFMASLFKASVRSFETHTQTKKFSLKTVRHTLVQLDGETLRIDADSTVQIGIKHKTLKCIV
jgi:diacylglycerol kinase (ATP)